MHVCMICESGNKVKMKSKGSSYKSATLEGEIARLI